MPKLAPKPSELSDQCLWEPRKTRKIQALCYVCMNHNPNAKICKNHRSYQTNAQITTKSQKHKKKKFKTIAKYVSICTYHNPNAKNYTYNFYFLFIFDKVPGTPLKFSFSNNIRRHRSWLSKRPPPRQ